MMPNFAPDALLKTLMPHIINAVKPIVDEVRGEILKVVAGPPPKAFVAKVKALFDVTDEEVATIWGYAIDAATELTAAGVALKAASSDVKGILSDVKSA